MTRTKKRSSDATGEKRIQLRQSNKEKKGRLAHKTRLSGTVIAILFFLVCLTMSDEKKRKNLSIEDSAAALDAIEKLNRGK